MCSTYNSILPNCREYLQQYVQYVQQYFTKLPGISVVVCAVRTTVFLPNCRESLQQYVQYVQQYFTKLPGISVVVCAVRTTVFYQIAGNLCSSMCSTYNSILPNCRESLQQYVQYVQQYFTKLPGISVVVYVQYVQQYFTKLPGISVVVCTVRTTVFYQIAGNLCSSMCSTYNSILPNCRESLQQYVQYVQQYFTKLPRISVVVCAVGTTVFYQIAGNLCSSMCSTYNSILPNCRESLQQYVQYVQQYFTKLPGISVVVCAVRTTVFDQIAGNLCSSMCSTHNSILPNCRESLQQYVQYVQQYFTKLTGISVVVCAVRTTVFYLIAGNICSSMCSTYNSILPNCRESLQQFVQYVQQYFTKLPGISVVVCAVRTTVFYQIAGNLCSSMCSTYNSILPNCRESLQQYVQYVQQYFTKLPGISVIVCAVRTTVFNTKLPGISVVVCAVRTTVFYQIAGNLCSSMCSTYNSILPNCRESLQQYVQYVQKYFTKLPGISVVVCAVRTTVFYQIAGNLCSSMCSTYNSILPNCRESLQQYVQYVQQYFTKLPGISVVVCAVRTTVFYQIAGNLCSSICSTYNSILPNCRESLQQYVQYVQQYFTKLPGISVVVCAVRTTVIYQIAGNLCSSMCSTYNSILPNCRESLQQYVQYVQQYFTKLPGISVVVCAVRTTVFYQIAGNICSSMCSTYNSILPNCRESLQQYVQYVQQYFTKLPGISVVVCAVRTTVFYQIAGNLCSSMCSTYNSILPNCRESLQQYVQYVQQYFTKLPGISVVVCAVRTTVFYKIAGNLCSSMCSTYNSILPNCRESLQQYVQYVQQYFTKLPGISVVVCAVRTTVFYQIAGNLCSSMCSTYNSILPNCRESLQQYVQYVQQYFTKLPGISVVVCAVRTTVFYQIAGNLCNSMCST